MSTEEIKGVLDFQRYKGVYGALSAIVALTVIVIQLPDTSIQALKERWIIILPFAIIILSVAMFSAYLQEQKSRTQIQVESSENIRQLTGSIREAIGELKAAYKMIDERFDVIDKRLTSIYINIEKRKEIVHTGETEKFTQET